MNGHLSQKPKRKRLAKSGWQRSRWYAAVILSGLIGLAVALGLLNSSQSTEKTSALRDALARVDDVNVTLIGGDKNGDEVVITFRAEHLDGARHDIVRLACELLTPPDADYRLRLIGTATFYHAGTPNNIPIIDVYLRSSDQLSENCSGETSEFDWESLAYYYSEYQALHPVLLTPAPDGR